jgi:catechol 2,3-dioxygenase-like lactoylglutathione lyase family enzyme
VKDREPLASCPAEGGKGEESMDTVAAARINLLVLKTRGLEKLKHFYTALGIRFTAEQHGKGPGHYAGQVGDLVLELYPLEDTRAADATTRLGLVVADLDAVVRSLATEEGVLVSQPRQTAWGLRAVVRDPDGRMVELYQG